MVIPFFELDLREFHDFYRRRNTTLTIAMREVNDTSCYGSIEVDWNGMITGFYEKSENGKKRQNKRRYLSYR